MMVKCSKKENFNFLQFLSQNLQVCQKYNYPCQDQIILTSCLTSRIHGLTSADIGRFAV